MSQIWRGLTEHSECGSYGLNTQIRGYDWVIVGIQDSGCSITETAFHELLWAVVVTAALAPRVHPEFSVDAYLVQSVEACITPA